MIFKAAWGANAFPAFPAESDCHSDFGDGGASGRPTQCVQRGSCAPDAPVIESANWSVGRTGAGVSVACP